MAIRIKISLLIIIIGLTFLDCEKNAKIIDKKYIMPIQGVALHKKPSPFSKTIVRIPYKDQVAVIEKDKRYVDFHPVYDNVKSKWVKVIYKNKKGWVYGGYLCQKDLLKSIFNPKEKLMGEWSGTKELERQKSDFIVIRIEQKNGLTVTFDPYSELRYVFKNASIRCHEGITCEILTKEKIPIIKLKMLTMNEFMVTFAIKGEAGGGLGKKATHPLLIKNKKYIRVI